MQDEDLPEVQNRPAVMAMCAQIELVIMMQNQGDVLNALGNVLLTAVIQSCETPEEAEEDIERAMAVLKAGVRRNWDPVRQGMGFAVNATGRA